MISRDDASHIINLLMNKKDVSYDELSALNDRLQWLEARSYRMNTVIAGNRALMETAIEEAS